MSNEPLPNESNSTSGSRRTLYIALILFLLLTNVVLIWKTLNSSKKIDDLEIKRTELDSSFNKVNGELQAKIQEYQQLMGENATLDSTLKANIAELQEKQGRIDKMMKEKNFTTAQYNRAKSEIEQLRTEKNGFVARIDSLSTALKYMTQVNDSLSSTLKGKIAEGEQLKGEKMALSKKVELGSLLKPFDIKATGVKYKGNGKEVEVDKAKKIEKLKICFKVPDNQVADAGEKTLLVSIQEPKGTTIAVESEGSGIFTTTTGEQKQYTTKATFTYDNSQKDICLYWKQSSQYSSGEYKVQFYQDGVPLSSGTFKLK